MNQIKGALTDKQAKAMENIVAIELFILYSIGPVFIWAMYAFSKYILDYGAIYNLSIILSIVALIVYVVEFSNIVNIILRRLQNSAPYIFWRCTRDDNINIIDLKFFPKSIKIKAKNEKTGKINTYNLIFTEEEHSSNIPYRIYDLEFGTIYIPDSEKM